MKKNLALLVLICVLISCHKRPAPVKQAGLIDQLLQTLSAQQLFNGSLVVADQGRVVLAKGYGHVDLQQQNRFTVDTLVDGGSMAKTVTAAGIYRLQEQGLLSVQDMVTDYLPTENLPEVRIEHLLKHTAGLPDDGYFFSKLPEHETITNHSFLTILQRKDFRINPPGQSFSYSNVGYILLAVITEQVSGQSYFGFLHANFFQPLNMHTPRLRPRRTTDWPKQAAVGFQLKDGHKSLNHINDWEAFNGCCNLMFSAADLHQWNASFFQHPQPLAHTMDAMPDDAIDQPGPLSPFSWYVEGDQAHFSGDWRGFYSLAYRDESKKRSIVYVSNNTIPN